MFLQKLPERIDAWFLKQYEHVGHWWERKSGKNCFWLARASNVAFTLSMLLYILLVFLYGEVEKTGRYMLFLSIAVLFGLHSPLAFYFIAKNENKINSFSVHRLAFFNPLREAWRRLRILYRPITFLTVTIIDILLFTVAPKTPIILGVVASGASLWLVSVLYFVSCNPLSGKEDKKDVVS